MSNKEPDITIEIRGVDKIEIEHEPGCGTFIHVWIIIMALTVIIN